MYELILASDVNFGIGFEGHLPWPKMPTDMEFFKTKTTDNIVIMGRKTWQSIPSRFRPLADRVNIVVSSIKSKDLDPPTKQLVESGKLLWFNSMLDIVRWVDKYVDGDGKGMTPYIIGGWDVYKWFLEHDIVYKIHLNMIENDYKVDTHFDRKYLKKFTMSSITTLDKGSDTTPPICLYEYKYSDINGERSYLSHLSRLLNGNYRKNRTGISTYSLFCPGPLRFNLRNKSFPLLTTKKMVIRQILVELQFYLSGKSDSNILNMQGVKVWNGNTTRDFLDSRGLKHYKEGDMGPSYSFNYRHFGAEYKGCQEDYTGQGFDQVKYCIDLIKNDPSSRRIMINLWDPSKIDQMALPPCMYSYQFYVEDKTLHCHASLRSSDTFLGLPWNIGTAALLTCMMAHVCDLEPGDLTITTNDAHIYENHINAVKEQLLRSPYPFPLLNFKAGTSKNIYEIEFGDIELLAYHTYPRLVAPMAV